MAASLSLEQMQALMRVALGEAPADLAIINGTVVNVYTGELMPGASVLVKGQRIAYVGKKVGRGIGADTQVIDARGKVLIPGLIDSHTHIEWMYSTSEVLRFALKGGTTTIITEVENLCFTMGYRGIIEFLKTTKNQPVKIFATVPPMVSISPVAREHAITLAEIRRLLRRPEVLGLGEAYWAQVVDGDSRVLELIQEALRQGKKVDGHTAGARDNKLQAYTALGVTSCHEPITAEEVKERLQTGLYVLLREGEVRRELEAVAKIKEDKLDLRRLAIATDGIDPTHLVTRGYMEFILQKAIDLGFDPIVAVQMTTINAAQRFALDDFIGGIAPGKYADIVILPDLKTISPECVISNGRVVARDGQLIVQPRKHPYPQSFETVRFPMKFDAGDFTVRANGKQAEVRVIDYITNLVTKEAVIEMPVVNGQLKISPDNDILKVAAIERVHAPPKSFVGFVRGLGLKRGAIASTAVWDAGNMVVAGTHESDMALAANRVVELGGGIVVAAGGKIPAELALPVCDISEAPMEVIAGKMQGIQRAAVSLGTTLSDIRLTMAVLTTPAIPFLRICESGLFDLKQNRFVNLIVP